MLVPHDSRIDDDNLRLLVASMRESKESCLRYKTCPQQISFILSFDGSLIFFLFHISKAIEVYSQILEFFLSKKFWKQSLVTIWSNSMPSRPCISWILHCLRSRRELEWMPYFSRKFRSAPKSKSSLNSISSAIRGTCRL